MEVACINVQLLHKQSVCFYIFKVPILPAKMTRVSNILEACVHNYFNVDGNGL